MPQAILNNVAATVAVEGAFTLIDRQPEILPATMEQKARRNMLERNIPGKLRDTIFDRAGAFYQ